LEELLDRCDTPFEAQHIVDALRELQLRCDAMEINSRPLFDEIRSNLSSLSAELLK
jgi:hypothetical protein